MKSNHKNKMTFGDLIAGVYSACGRRKAKALMRFAVNEHVVVFRGRLRYAISSR
jgi:hypothetical protein